jgi:hypothetical protein
MHSKLISLLEELQRELDSANSNGYVNNKPGPMSEPARPGLLEPFPSASSPSNPLQVLISRRETVESAWKYAEVITEEYPGDDGGHLSDASCRLLNVDEPKTAINSDDRARVLNTEE